MRTNLTWVPVRKVGRDAGTGRFISVAEAQRRPPHDRGGDDPLPRASPADPRGAEQAPSEAVVVTQ